MLQPAINPPVLWAIICVASVDGVGRLKRSSALFSKEEKLFRPAVFEYKNQQFHNAGFPVS